MLLKRYPNRIADNTRRQDHGLRINFYEMDGELLSTMTDRQVSCLYMRYHLGLKLKDIARSLGLSISTIRGHVQAAELELMRQMKTTSRRSDG